MIFVRTVDSHMHLNDPKFSRKDRERILADMNRQNLSGICSGWDYASGMEAVQIAEQYPFIYATAGLHPAYVDGAQIELLTELPRLAQSGKIVALGECGLDKCCPTDWKFQRRALGIQLDLAERLGFPIVLHVRKAHEEMLKVLSERKGRIRCMLHGCSASAEQVQRYLSLGCSISISGTVTWNGAVKSTRAAKTIPLEKLMIETDSPYLAPEPFRGSMNDPKNILLVGSRISEIREMPEETLLRQTCLNAMQFFRLM